MPQYAWAAASVIIGLFWHHRFIRLLRYPGAIPHHPRGMFSTEAPVLDTLGRMRLFVGRPVVDRSHRHCSLPRPFDISPL